MSEDPKVELVTPQAGLPTVSEEEILELRRLAFKTAYEKIRAALLEEPEDFSGKMVQANLALNYVKHTEQHNMAALQLGRGRNDKQLAAEILKLRREMAEAAKYRARLEEEDE